MQREQKTAPELATLVRNAMGEAEVQNLSVVPDKVYGWTTIVIAMPSLVGDFQAKAELIARELRSKYDLKP